MFGGVPGGVPVSVLGIDPGLTHCGWGLVRRDGVAMACDGYGTFETPSNAPLPERLHELHLRVASLLDRLHVDAVAVERVLFNVNVRTAMATGQACGVVLLACGEGRRPVVQYAPTQVKSAVCGYGAATKAQMRATVRRQLRLPAEPPTDAADALALAICHLAGDRLAMALESQTIVDAGPAVDPARRLRDAIAQAVSRDERKRGSDS